MDFVNDDDDNYFDDADLFHEAAALAAEAEVNEEPIGGGLPTEKKKSSSKHTDRLYKDAARLTTAKEQKRMDREFNGCTFQPELIARDVTGRGAPGRRGHSELVSKLHKYQEKLDTSKADARATTDVECTFHPQLLGHRASAAKCKNPSRLYDKAMKNIKKKDDLHAEIGNFKDHNCTFSPTINRSSRRSPATKANPKRLYDLDKITKKKLETEQLRIARETQECTFSPEVRVAHDEDDQSEDVHQRLFGLATKYEQKRMLRGEQINAEIMCEHTFSPNLKKKNPTSTVAPDSLNHGGPPKMAKDYAPPSEAFGRLYTNAVRKNAQKIENYQTVGYRVDVMSPKNPNFSHR